MNQHTPSQSRRVLALDLGDRRTTLARREGDKIVHEEFATTPEVLADRFTEEPPTEVILEAGSQSHWIAWMLSDLGHKAVVVHPRRLKMITQSSHKTDRSDAEWLLRLGEADVDILSPILVRSRAQQADLVLLRIRRTLTNMRKMAVQAVRGHAKIFGCALPSGGVAAFPRRAREGLCGELKVMCEPLLHQIEQLTQTLARIETKLTSMADNRYPETILLRQVHSIGPLTALNYVLTLQTSKRFTRSRQAGPAVGLVPKKRASGSRDPELRITKQGDLELRRLLVLAAHRIMAGKTHDSDLKRFGLRLAARGGKNAKKRAVVAVARKLSVLLMALWRSGEVYEPLRQGQRDETAATSEAAEPAVAA